MLSESNPWVVFDYPDRFVHPAGKVESVPVQEVGAEIIDRRYAVLDRLPRNEVSLWKDNPTSVDQRTTSFMGT